MKDDPIINLDGESQKPKEDISKSLEKEQSTE